MSSSILCSNAALRNAWYAVARSIDVAAAPKSVTLLGTKVVLYRAGAGVVAAPDRCPHREAPLSAGHIGSDGCLVCPYHGWAFGDGGHCVRVPSTADSVPPPPRAHLTTFAAQEKYGLVWLCVGTPVGNPPVIPNEDDPAYRRINTPVDVWQCSATRMADNFLDITHFPFVHLGTFGRSQDTVVPKLQLEELDNGWYGYKYDVRAANSPLGTLVSGQAGEIVERSMSSGFHLPFDVRSTIAYHTGLQHILLLLSAPIDDVTSYFTFVVWRNDDFSMSAEEIIRFDLAIGAEDKRMLEQLDGVLPLDKTTLVNAQADKASVEWRRRLHESMSAG
ncbi:MAG: aromatic ring-hydroxylating dioxygenase subunit alpha [Actinobacteria bacterium]|nr:aromatic ring-hydroxylating dioxygenase subunit alpha [Actinomycetota bacterium]